MKKLFVSLCVLSFVSGMCANAATTNDKTYTEQFVQKHTQKVVDKEKNLRNKADKAKSKQQAKKAAAQKKHAEQKAKLQQKKDAVNTLKSW